MFRGRSLARPQPGGGPRARMGYVVQDGGLFPHLDARGNVTLMARHLRWPRGAHRVPPGRVAGAGPPARRPARPLPGATVRRPAPAGQPAARLDAGPRGVAARRTSGGARSAGAGRSAGRSGAHLSIAAQDGDPGDPRSGRGGLLRRAAGPAARGTVWCSGAACEDLVQRPADPFVSTLRAGAAAVAPRPRRRVVAEDADETRPGPAGCTPGAAAAGADPAGRCLCRGPGRRPSPCAWDRRPSPNRSCWASWRPCWRAPAAAPA